MSQRLYVATRKGLFTFEDRRTRWEVVGTAFLGEPVTMVLQDRRDSTLYAALNLGHFGVKIHKSTDDGKSWEECAVPVYPKSAEGDAPSLVQIWSLETGAAPGELWAGTIPGGLFRSTDRGASWELNTGLWNRPEREQWQGGGYDKAGIHSVIVDPRNANRITVGVSVGGTWISEDGGASWEIQGRGMYAEYMPPELRDEPTAQDPHRLAYCKANPDIIWCQHHNGAFRSYDGGKTFTEIVPRPSKFGFAVAAHPTVEKTAWFVPAVKDECRIPVDGKLVVSRTRDGGKTFETLHNGLPQEHAYDLIFRHALDIDDSGEVLAMGSTTGSLWATSDGGDMWRTVNKHLPPVYAVHFGN